MGDTPLKSASLVNLQANDSQERVALAFPAFLILFPRDELFPNKQEFAEKVQIAKMVSIEFLWTILKTGSLDGVLVTVDHLRVRDDTKLAPMSLMID